MMDAVQRTYATIRRVLTPVMLALFKVATDEAKELIECGGCDTGGFTTPSGASQFCTALVALSFTSEYAAPATLGLFLPNPRL